MFNLTPLLGNAVMPATREPELIPDPATGMEWMKSLPRRLLAVPKKSLAKERAKKKRR
jgi:hypothetical protein